LCYLSRTPGMLLPWGLCIFCSLSSHRHLHGLSPCFLQVCSDGPFLVRSFLSKDKIPLFLPALCPFSLLHFFLYYINNLTYYIFSYLFFACLTHLERVWQHMSQMQPTFCFCIAGGPAQAG
jgi:hypothetical protein